MKIERLLEILQILMLKGRVTAKELSDRFEVSSRTIYRDIDTLSLAGIPVFSERGKGGGIGLLPEYTIANSFLTEKEQREVLFALQSLSAAEFPDIDNTLEKIGKVFKGAPQTSWIDVDFSFFGSGKEEKGKFDIIKKAILAKRVLSFDYFSAYGGKTSREIEALKLIFKGRAWYLYGFCREKQDFRVFRVSRMKNLFLSEEIFEREAEGDFSFENAGSASLVTLTLKFSGDVFYRLCDEFESSQIESAPDRSYIVTVQYPYEEWVVGHLLSFGSDLEILSPAYVKDAVVAKAEELIKKYKNI